MNDRELAEILGGHAALAELRARGMPEQRSIHLKVGADDEPQRTELEADSDYIARLLSWVRARSSRDRFLDAQDAPNPPAMRAAIVDHLRGVLDGALPAVDREVVAVLMIALEQSASGEVPDLFALPPRKKGAHIESRALRACIEDAGAYVVYCLQHKGSRWIDRSPVKTVAELYRVSHDTAKRWKSHVSPVALAAITKPEVAGEPRTLAFRKLRAAMRASAVQYARFGALSADAVGRRARGARTEKLAAAPVEKNIAAELHAIRTREAPFVADHQRAARLGSTDAQRWLSERGYDW